MKKTFLILCWLIAKMLSAQDLIIKTDSARIPCWIVKEDSVNIYYNKDITSTRKPRSVAKRNVVRYYVTDGVKISGVLKAKVQPYFHHDLLKTDYRSVILWKEDRIQLTENNEFEFRGCALDMNELVDLVCHDSVAFHEMKIARRSYNRILLSDALLSSLLITAYKIPLPILFKYAGITLAGGTYYLVTKPSRAKALRHAMNAIRLFNWNLPAI